MTRKPLEILPKDAKVYVKLDLGTLRRSPHYSQIKSSAQHILSSLEQRGAVSAEHTPWMTLIDHSVELHLAVAPPNRSAIIVVKGTETFETNLKQILRTANGSEPTTNAKSITRAYRILRDAKNDYIDIGKHVWIIAERNSAQTVLARALGKQRDSLESAPLYQALQADINLKTSSLAVLADVKDRKVHQIPQVVQRFGLGVTLAKHFDAKVAADTDRPESATQLESVLRQRLDLLTSQWTVKLMGWAPLLQRIKLWTQGNRLSIHANLDEPEVRRVLSQVDSIFSLTQKHDTENSAQP